MEGRGVTASPALHPCPAPACSKLFSQKSNAQSHYKNVHLNKKDQCGECGKHVRKLKVCPVLSCPVLSCPL